MPSLEQRREAGTWFRHVRFDRSPTTDPPDPADGRWQRGQVAEGFYLVDSEETARAEWDGWLAERGFVPRIVAPRDLWRFDVDLVVANLSTVDRLANHGLLPPTPDSLTWSQYQKVGEELFQNGWDGVIAPSAFRPTGLTLCVFRRGSPLSGVHAVSLVERWEEPPAPRRA